MTNTTVVNGVNTTALSDTIEAVRAKRELGEVTFKVNGEWRGGFQLESATGDLVQAGEADTRRAGKFRMSSDEPQALLGGDTAVSPGSTSSRLWPAATR